VAQHLAVRSLEHYLPLFGERSRWTDRTVAIDRPLFPGYVFIRFGPNQRLTVISTPGVLSVVGNGQDGNIPVHEIERIQIALTKGYQLQPHPRLSVGMRVRVTHGVFAGAEGIVSELRRNCKVVMALSSVGQCFSLEATAEEIEVLDRDSPQSCAGPFHTRRSGITTAHMPQ
jgi:transcription antitermination factor NusG